MMLLNRTEEREIDKIIERFIMFLDGIGLTCEFENEVGVSANALLSGDDYAQLEKILYRWSLNEKIRKLA